MGITIGTGTDIAIEASDVTLVKGDLSAVVSAVKLSNSHIQEDQAESLLSVLL